MKVLSKDEFTFYFFRDLSALLNIYARAFDDGQSNGEKILLAFPSEFEDPIVCIRIGGVT